MTDRTKKRYEGKASSHETRTPGEFTYHYDREERLKGLSFDFPRQKSRGIFRRNRGLTFILIDVFILFLIGFVLVPLLRARMEVETWKGYVFEIEATRFDDTVFAKLTISDRGDGAYGGEPIEVTFSYGDTIVGDSYAEFFPEAADTEVSVRTSYPRDPAESRIAVRVVHQGETLSLRARIR
jgi:hypothetical protein